MRFLRLRVIFRSLFLCVETEEKIVESKICIKSNEMVPLFC